MLQAAGPRLSAFLVLFISNYTATQWHDDLLDNTKTTVSRNDLQQLDLNLYHDLFVSSLLSLDC